MPTPAARAAFNEAQVLAAQMRSIHEQELAVENSGGNAEFERRLEALRNKWLELAGRYTEAVERFTAELERARSNPGGDGRSA